MKLVKIADLIFFCGVGQIGILLNIVNVRVSWGVVFNFFLDDLCSIEFGQGDIGRARPWLESEVPEFLRKLLFTLGRYNAGVFERRKFNFLRPV